MVDTSTLVSVVIPVYNAMPYLGQALDSVQAQTHENLEIICVNDGSTDSSLSVMQAHAAVDDRIVIIDKENEGYGASMNRGISQAHGSWIAIVEPDDWIEPGMYADMLRFAASFEKQQDRIDIIKTPFYNVLYSDTKQQRICECPYKYLIAQSKQVETVHELTTLCRHHPSIWSALYRKDFLDEHEIRFLPIPGSGWADNPFFMETLVKARGIVYLDQAYYCYRADTLEQAEAYHRKNPMIPFERWNQMLDIIESAGADSDEELLMAHYSHGFLYMSGAIEVVSMESDESVRSAVEQMFSRMDPLLVDRMGTVKPGVRRLFAEVRGLPAPDEHRVKYVASLVQQTMQDARTMGIAETARCVWGYFARYGKRSGGR